MPRSLRIEYPGAVYHVMCRGNNRQDIFHTDDGYRLFLATLTEACEQTGWVVHAFCLMRNHYHLLLETPEPNLVAGMKWFQGTYTQRHNAMFNASGHLFQGRYKALPVSFFESSEYFRMLSTYIHLNPFRAELCGEGYKAPLESYRWSSYPAYVGKKRKFPEWLVRDRVLKTWGISLDQPRAMVRYKEKLELFMLNEIDPDAALREMFDKQLKRGWYFGSVEFGQKLSAMLTKRSKGDNFRGEQRRLHGEAEAERLLKAGLKVLGLNEKELLERRPSDLKKQAIAWLINDHTTVTGRWLAGRIQLGAPVNVSRALKRFRTSNRGKERKLKKALKACISDVGADK